MFALQPSPIIWTEYGPIRGEILSSGFFSKYYSFKGIPYAKPPIGNLRFMPPREPDSWTEVRDALAHGSHCPGKTIVSTGINEDEDCLFLNVYTPSLPGNSNSFKPVMFFIHGGAFVGGSGDSFYYGPDYFVNENVVLVTINYRLGALGFLSTGDSAAAGNVGLKDQIAALKWVKANIARFGGDPDNVTIFGESAGAVSVHYLILSPLAKGYFHKAISQSGSSLNPWAFQPDPRKSAFELGRKLGITTTNSKELVLALQNIPVFDIMRVQPGTLSTSIPRGLVPQPFVPSVDAFANNSEIVLPKTPIEIIKSGVYNKVPYICGFNSHEAFIMLPELQLDSLVFPTLNQNRELLIPFSWNLPKESKVSKLIAKEIWNFYFQGKSLSKSKDMSLRWVDFMTDQMFVVGIDNTVKLQSETSSTPIYYYKFSFDGDLNLAKALLFIKYKGACHTDELFYLFKVAGLPLPLLPINPAAITLRRMVRMWTNFSKSGKPTPYRETLLNNVIWPRITKTINYLDIDENFVLGVNPYSDRMTFWNNLKKLYNS
ncbi:carboxylesterase 4A-like [Ctenocephalides felis]|uniref:carboxylesterase 4A-like n=1 Tax=Ctenocephalides felis TaxID=7515 RepID=UPI000E6E2423|nr:carboxylesterase 4A-like [Ctenocephalides felis]